MKLYLKKLNKYIFIYINIKYHLHQQPPSQKPFIFCD